MSLLGKVVDIAIKDPKWYCDTMLYVVSITKLLEKWPLKEEQDTVTATGEADATEEQEAKLWWLMRVTC